MTLGDFIKERRTELGLTRNFLAGKAGISHTELRRIETNLRTMPSLKILGALAEALELRKEDLLHVAGYLPGDEISATERAFPGLTRRKQQETVEKIVDGLCRNADLDDEDLDKIYEQVEMAIDYAKKKKDS